MLKLFSLRMEREDDYCYTLCEAGSAMRAKMITEQSWRDGWRATEIKETQTFYLELFAEDPEARQAQIEENIARLKAANKKGIITPEGEFASIKDAAKKYGSTYAVRKLMQSNPKEFYYK